MAQNPFSDPNYGTTAPGAKPPSKNPFLDPDYGKEPAGRSATDYVRDAAAWAAKGAVAVPEAVVGLADIATGGRAGKLLENEGGAVGFRPKQAREAINEWHSDATKEAQRKFQEAEGLGGKFQAALENPSNIVGAVVESLPAMGAGGVVARGLGAATRLGQAGAKGAAAAGALGEGIVGAGSAAEQIRQESEDGLLSPGQTAAAAATGAATAGLGYAGGRVAQRLGIGDAETMLAQGNKGIAKQFADDAATAAANPLVQQRAVKSIPAQVIQGAISEGFLEELPQSVAEQIFQNLALGKDWSEDVDTAVVLGTLSGAAMGGGAAGYRAAREPRVPAGQPGETPTADQPGAEQAAAGAPGAAGPAEGASAEGAATPPNAGLETMRREFEARMSQLQQEEGGEPQVPQSTPPDGAAALAQQRAQEQALRDAEMSANRAVQSPDDEILQSTGAAMPPSRAMGLDPAAGSLSAAAALAVDSGAAAQTQQADALAQAAEVAARAPAKKKATERQVTADPATGEIEGGALATWTDEDLSNGFRSAQAKNVRLQLARELARRRAERDQQAAAPAPATTSTTQQGSIDGTQADQAQPPRAESSPAAGAQGAPVAGSAAAQELTDGTTSSQHDGAQAGAAPGPQAQAPIQTPVQRIDAGRAAWASMPAAERKALAGRLEGLKPVIRKALPGATWERLNVDLQRKIADAIAPQGAIDDSTAPAVRLADERPAGPAATAQAGSGQPAGRAPDAQPAGPRGGGAGQPAAGVQSAVPGRIGASEQAATVAPAAAPAPTAGEQQAQAIAKEGNDARRAQLLAASERWTKMSAAERQAVAKGAKGLNAPARASSHSRAWADLAPKVREKLAAAMPDAAAAPAAPAARTLRTPAGVQYQSRGEDVPSKGLAVANLGNDGVVYVGKPNSMHFVVAEKHTAQAGGFAETGFVTPQGEFLDREQALAWVDANEKSVKPSENMARGLDALDYREQVPESARSAGTDRIDVAAKEAATSPANDLPQPTEAQKDAGNYRKGHVRLNGLDISIENPAGSRRRPEWPPLQSHYGYIKGSVGADKDHVDVFMADRASDPDLPVFVVDQVNRDGSFDEHKVVLGAADEADARATYLGNYEKGWTGLGAITKMTQDEFKAWVRDPAKTKKPVGTLRGAAPAPAPKKPRGILAKKAAAEEAARAAYYTPGNILKSYGGGFDRVVSYTPANADGVWSVTVREVEKQGSGWEDVPGVRERTHATPPSARELKAGPVERTEELPFRRGEADAQGLTDEQMANLLRIMRPEPAAFSDAARAQAVGQVRQTVDAIRKGWSNGPEVVVAFDMNDPAVPEAARRADLRQRSGGASGAPEGFYWRGKAYLLASKLNTPADAARVLHHEVLGHHGLRGMFGPELNKILNQVATMRQAEVAAKIKEYGLPGVTDLSRRHAAEEVLAEMAEKTPQLHFVRRAVAAIRNWLRANVPGFRGLKLSDADIIQGYILPARDFVERGQRAVSDRVEPVFSRSDSPSITPDAIIGSTLGSASKHPDYAAAKGGDVAAATRLAVDLVTPEMVAKVAAALGGARPRVLPVAAEEASGRNKIPRAVSEVLAARLGLETATGIVQANRARRTGLDGLDRIFAPVDFAGAVEPGDYLLVDDTLTQGGTFAALASHVREGGGNVVGVVALTGKQYSAKIQPSPEILATLRQKHGDLEDQFRAATGYGFDALTESEARYLARFEPAERLRDRIAEEGRRGSERADQGNPRQGDDADDLSFSRTRLSAIKDSALDQLQKTMSHPGKISVWDKTIGTMRHLAERVPEFKPVYETAQQNIDDVSMLANDAADRAPRLLPRVDTIGDLVGKNRKTPVSAADNKAVAKPLFEGTLLWGRDVDGKAVLVDELAKKYGNLPADDKAQLLLRAGRLDDRMLGAWRGLPLAQYEANVNSRFDSKMLKAGTVWTDAELQTMFGATPNQIALYREARAAIDRSIDMTARADMMRALGDEYAPMRDMVLDAPKLSDALELLTTTLQHDAKAKPELADRLLQLNNLVVDRAATAKDLQDAGYAPLSRFGRYTLDVVDQDGNRQYFGMYESMKDSNLAKIQMAQAFPGAVITQGTMSQQSFKLFAGITPETLEIFKDMVVGKEADAATRKVYDEYLKLTKNNHSALKRLIQRKGIEGYSQDVGRVVANFVYSNARQGAAGLNAGTMDRAINDIPKDQGELKDLAMGLRSYIRDPQEEGQAVRGMLFAQYLGGSLASAFVNMTQPFAVTLPWLSQFGGIRAASGQMTRALKDMGTRGMKYETDLAHALKSAEDDGVVSPQEVHQLMAQARGAGGLRSGDGTRAGDARAAAGNAWERAKVAWGQPFALAEQFNRRSTFIAAFRIARAQGMPDPGAFARKAVLETQFVYSKANKPQWARGAVGGTLFTFKTYSVSYLELMQRMWKQGGPEGKRAVGWALAMLLLMGGAGGVPFAEDVEDLIDGAGQLMGYNISSKQWRKQALAGIVGKELGEFMEQGLSGLPGAPIDVSGRLGMGNLIPGTGLFLTKQSRERDLLEVVGPAGDLVARGFTAGRKVLTGDVAGAALEVSPTALRNLAKGADMATTGMYRDQKGYKVIDTTLAEAAAKAIGFQPKSVAEVQEANSFMQRSKSFYTQTSSDIKAQWAQAVFEKDDAGLQRVRDRLADWNKNNPEQPIVVKIPDVMKRVREMNKDRADRIADTSPKALRQQMREMAATVG
ncbi:PLxRFG domain-containing protein [Delftia sp. S66]|uniref:PLxRFG domain-containing protein n=1 Tax=Delftia sp. S66 TaxID=2767437 RepID=UPI00190766BC|nr:PLxRFG domain-containing protein [Delftia sp. S66]MBK0130199.1 PLxRFG domain-containing protein [Delftia sp. S66]